MSKLIRTPDLFFDQLEDFPYKPNYINDLSETNGARLHYIDVGQDINGIALLLHGNFSWSYGYRKMIPYLVREGYRVIAPDMIGFGRSDKPLDKSWHTYKRHRTILINFIEYLNLKKIFLVCHDWGGMLSLSFVPELESLFDKILIMNTHLIPPGGGRMLQTWYEWVRYAKTQNDIDILKCFEDIYSVRTKIEDMKGFIAPYPDYTYKAAITAFPNFLPDQPYTEGFEQNGKAIEFWKKDWKGQAFIAVGVLDYIFREPTIELAKKIKNCPEPFLIDCGHFVTEWGDIVLDEAFKFFKK